MTDIITKIIVYLNNPYEWLELKDKMTDTDNYNNINDWS